ncbi:unnamed protein product [Rhizoctonia solani]|uniref:Laminin domain protein n=1 Tax=Rhizoctonia solani TaxID=456999 RepID=A0A8H3HI57_9AGAM|nr:unnamed protein product [Rhizoctonia solani]CAE6515397.1 unnamed protein product [Rhizoctonia solani]
MSYSGGMVLTPPQLPDYLSDTYVLNRITGKPTDEEIKLIHAAIRGLNSVSHLPSLYNPDLSMQLSQHLFDAQMVVYRANRSNDQLSGAPLGRETSTYTPPTLPPDIPGKLSRVVGAPSDMEVQSVQSVLRHVENLSHNPQRYDANLSMQLSQHLFDIQLARHIHNAAQGVYGSNDGEPDVQAEMGSRVLSGLTRLESVLQDIKETTTGSKAALEDINQAISSGQGTHSSGEKTTSPELATGMMSGLSRMEQLMIQMQETMKGSKDILENVNRVLMSSQRTQSTVGSFDSSERSTVHMNPVNQQGILASECGLPMLRYWLTGAEYVLWMDDPAVAKYLKFFNVGSHLIQNMDQPTLIDGGTDEAAKLLFKHIGLYYSGAKNHLAQTT